MTENVTPERAFGHAYYAMQTGDKLRANLSPEMQRAQAKRELIQSLEKLIDQFDTITILDQILQNPNSPIAKRIADLLPEEELAELREEWEEDYPPQSP